MSSGFKVDFIVSMMGGSVFPSLIDGCEHVICCREFFMIFGIEFCYQGEAVHFLGFFYMPSSGLVSVEFLQQGNGWRFIDVKEDKVD